MKKLSGVRVIDMFIKKIRLQLPSNLHVNFSLGMVKHIQFFIVNLEDVLIDHCSGKQKIGDITIYLQYNSIPFPMCFLSNTLSRHCCIFYEHQFTSNVSMSGIWHTFPTKIFNWNTAQPTLIMKLLSYVAYCIRKLSKNSVHQDIASEKLWLHLCSRQKVQRSESWFARDSNTSHSSALYKNYFLKFSLFLFFKIFNSVVFLFFISLWINSGPVWS